MGTRSVGVNRVAPFNDSRGRCGDPDGGTVDSSGVGDLSGSNATSCDWSELLFCHQPQCPVPGRVPLAERGKWRQVSSAPFFGWGHGIEFPWLSP